MNMKILIMMMTSMKISMIIKMKMIIRLGVKMEIMILKTTTHFVSMKKC